MIQRNLSILFGALLAATACKKQEPAAQAPVDAGSAAAPDARKAVAIGLVTDVGGRGDQSYNDSALRGLELWAGGRVFEGSSYREATAEELKAAIPSHLASHTPAIQPVGITPVILQSRVPEDYEPNLQTMADRGVSLSIGLGFMVENAIEIVAKRNPDAKFLLVDSVLVSSDGKPYTLPNVRTVGFREEEGSFLVGALAGLATKAGKVGFVGGMEVPIIKKFEAGFRAGVAATNPKATVLVNYTGSFDKVAVGKQVGQDLVAKGADVVYQAAGADGLGVIQAVKEARSAGKSVYVIGVDSDQAHLAPEAVLTSMIKHVDLAVYSATRDVAEGTFTGGDVTLGLKEGGVGYAPVRVDFPDKDEAIQQVEALKAKIIAGELKVPAK